MILHWLCWRLMYRGPTYQYLLHVGPVQRYWSWSWSWGCNRSRHHHCQNEIQSLISMDEPLIVIII